MEDLGWGWVVGSRSENREIRLFERGMQKRLTNFEPRSGDAGLRKTWDTAGWQNNSTPCSVRTIAKWKVKAQAAF